MDFPARFKREPICSDFEPAWSTRQFLTIALGGRRARGNTLQRMP
jgi:hypothetical protein